MFINQSIIALLLIDFNVETVRKGRGATDRHVFLFDHLLVLTKVQRYTKFDRPVYKYKTKVLIRKTDIFDLNDSEGEDFSSIFLFCYPSGRNSLIIIIKCF